MLIRKESDGKEEAPAERALLLFSLLIERESEGSQLVLLRSVEYVRSLGRLERVLKCVCLRCTTASSA